MSVADAASALDQMMLPLDGEQQKTDKARLTEEDTSDVAVSVDEEFKLYMHGKGVNIDANLFELKFNPPLNFASHTLVD